MSRILQFNCNGFFKHLNEIQILIVQQQPEIVCLQETHLKENNQPYLQGYKTYHKPRITNHASGGASISVKSDIHTETVRLNDGLEAIAIQIHQPNHKLTICNMYIPPDKQLNLNEIEHIVNQLPIPYIIVGDFNAHSKLWGCNRYNNQGKIIEKLLDRLDMTLLNTGQPTHFSSANKSFSAIDLSICHAKIASKLTWSTLSDLAGSDHFPIIIDNIRKSTQPSSHHKKWKISKADWELFAMTLNLSTLTSHQRDNVDQLAEKITKTIIDAAKKAIPSTECTKKGYKVPWWNSRCKSAIKSKTVAFNQYQRNKTIENWIEYKKCKAIARRTVKISKQQTWASYINTINNNPIST